MKQFLLTMAGVFVGLMLFFFVAMVSFFGFIASIASSSSKDITPAHAVLELDLRQGLSDQDPQNAFAIFSGGSQSVMTIIQVLRAAETDNKVEAIFVRLPEGGVAPAAADELRLAFQHFKKSGKPIWAHSQGLYPSGAVVSTYMLGASADQLWMQPDSSFQAVGMASEDMFFKRFFDKYGVRADYEQRYEYKNAVNPYLYSDYTAAHRESELSWMGSIYRTAVLTASADRKQNPQTFLATLEAGPYSAEEARAKGLIDQVGQVKDAEDALIAKVGGDAKLADFDDYAGGAKARMGSGSGPVIAVIGAEGAIMTGKGGGGSPFGGEQTVWSDDVAKAIYEAAEDKDVKAIVFRVSSPGGSDTASEQILAAVRAAKKAGKPVVVSMGTYAASGGYWISSQASAIVSQPTTLTGSIGVFGGKFALGEALGKFGVDVRGVSVGSDYAGAFGTGDEFTPKQRAAFSAWMDRIYGGFVARVAEGRKLPQARVREIAKGRVWTGVQAQQLGLVDQIGGFYDAVDRAKALAGVKGEVRLKMIGGAKSPFEALGRLFGGTETSMKTLAAAAWVMGDPRSQAILDQMAQSRLRDRGATVLAPTPIRQGR
ncbi:protease-4 [Caulobacter ginsengisoli]|uniref:Protease-4 n=1 Tax=Caulobacter ginsengisoli TaxID=400775 RepID=A0ABU0IQM0_9CAUL|nr:signal peptide peptidase SppA [Caulobacter ginsengisoli]MDQ0463468.1 protease-4 [Caulobacter ginsengisoli]